ncbi:MAG: TolC family protein [Syntrophorhabdales bacterium]|jgi:cobalt-zinc-cadmium efflux system outer membrane protein
MHRLARSLLVLFVVVISAGKESFAQQPLTWQQVRAKFIATNPTLLAGRLGIEESKAEEITANLRPNPQFTAATDYIHPFKSYGALEDAQPSVSVGYLIERMNKRGLRLETARKGTAVAASQLADQERTLLFTLRSAFIQVLQQKALLALAREDLAYYDKVLDVSAERFRTGDIARIDLDRLQLIRVQYESELETAIVSLRTAKIQLLMLLNERTPVEAFDVAGPFDFSEAVSPLSDFRAIALEARPDLRAAVQSIDQAKSAQQLAEANASTDPTVSIDFGRFPQTTVPAPSVVSYAGLSVSIPLRIFDRNQGERARTKLDITRNERLRDVTEAQLYNDVDSAHATLNGTVVLLKPYKTQYLKQALTVRDTVTFSYERGGASLLDFLQAQADYRSVQIAYLNLVGSYLSAAAQLNLAVGREVIQ